jgi:hypothetical protein
MSESDHRLATARFVIEAADAAGIRLGTDGYWLDALYPPRLDREVWRGFSRAITEYRPEIIALIQQEHAEREGSS